MSVCLSVGLSVCLSNISFFSACDVYLSGFFSVRPCLSVCLYVLYMCMSIYFACVFVCVFVCICLSFCLSGVRLPVISVSLSVKQSFSFPLTNIPCNPPLPPNPHTHTKQIKTFSKANVPGKHFFSVCIKPSVCQHESYHLHTFYFLLFQAVAFSWGSSYLSFQPSCPHLPPYLPAISYVPLFTSPSLSSCLFTFIASPHTFFPRLFLPFFLSFLATQCICGRFPSYLSISFSSLFSLRFFLHCFPLCTHPLPICLLFFIFLNFLQLFFVLVYLSFSFLSSLFHVFLIFLLHSFLFQFRLPSLPLFLF